VLGGRGEPVTQLKYAADEAHRNESPSVASVDQQCRRVTSLELEEQ